VIAVIGANSLESVVIDVYNRPICNHVKPTVHGGKRKQDIKSIL